ncbi:DUF4194 domain-containing protein [Herminiimonas fonticola]|uniref:Uncharacterized protein DUF4194 n=1 Tax=Herminiimonas fonticola TaxID=303380 RepID=A0A4R6GIE6_9BURK|nr:DUF4194 domain-containing protein [Herminiimonas fonticola]RBA25671.1 hypothetical protein Hfont_1304 [Herminiimonas fonticola]TDN94779.1 uncharacterized protein DUF4194 [Herminiimonas fonticola]
MMTSLEAKLTERNITQDRFREVTTRLFAVGTIVRAEGGVEERLYDDARRIAELLEDYLGFSGFRLIHDEKIEAFRLYAPGTHIPGVQNDELDPVPSLRAKTSADFVAAALALRFLYQQGLADGSTLSDKGEVHIQLEALATTLQTQLKRPFPESMTERRAVIMELRRHRIIRTSSNFTMTDEDELIAILPTIMGLMGEDVLVQAMAAEGVLETEEDADSDTDEDEAEQQP